MSRFFVQYIFIIRFLLCLVALSPVSVWAQTVMTLQATISINQTPNLDSTLILLENEPTEVISQNAPTLRLKVVARQLGDKRVQFVPTLQAYHKGTAMPVHINAFKLGQGERKQGVLALPKLGKLRFQFYFSGQTALQEKLPDCLYQQCQSTNLLPKKSKP